MTSVSRVELSGQKDNPRTVAVITRGPAKVGGAEVRKIRSDGRNRMRGHGMKRPWSQKGLLPRVFLSQVCPQHASLGEPVASVQLTQIELISDDTEVIVFLQNGIVLDWSPAAPLLTLPSCLSGCGRSCAANLDSRTHHRARLRRPDVPLLEKGCAIRRLRI